MDGRSSKERRSLRSIFSFGRAPGAVLPLRAQRHAATAKTKPAVARAVLTARVLPPPRGSRTPQPPAARASVRARSLRSVALGSIARTRLVPRCVVNVRVSNVPDQAAENYRGNGAALS